LENLNLILLFLNFGILEEKKFLHSKDFWWWKCRHYNNFNLFWFRNYITSLFKFKIIFQTFIFIFYQKK